MEYTPAERISLRSHPDFSEDWLQQLIEQDPRLLGLGDLEVKDVQRPQSRGRLDLLLQDPESKRRYEVEIQLGATDPSHIIRVLEYWDVERKRYPQYDHCAVLIAEDITSRFLNIISLLNGAIPLIALQVSAVKVGDRITLIFTKVLDEMTRGLVDADEDATPRADRQFWEQQKRGKDFLELVDQLFAVLESVCPGILPRYTRRYVSSTRGGNSDNIFIIVPRATGAIARLYIDHSETFDEMLTASGLDYDPYNQRYGHYQLRLAKGQVAQSRAVIAKIFASVLDAAAE